MPRMYRFFTGLGVAVMHRLGRKRGHLSSLGVDNGWTQTRDFPVPEGSTFMRQWQQRQKSGQRDD